MRYTAFLSVLHCMIYQTLKIQNNFAIHLTVRTVLVAPKQCKRLLRICGEFKHGWWIAVFFLKKNVASYNWINTKFDPAVFGGCSDIQTSNSEFFPPLQMILGLQTCAGHTSLWHKTSLSSGRFTSVDMASLVCHAKNGLSHEASNSKS